MNYNYESYTELHRACHKGDSLEVISELIEKGGKKLVMATDQRNRRTALHYVCSRCKEDHVRHDGSCNDKSWAPNVVKKLLEVGGKELVMLKAEIEGYSALHYETANPEASPEVVRELLSVGGKELAFAKGTFLKATALHNLAAESQKSVHINEILRIIVSVGGEEILYEKDFGCQNVLHCAVTDSSNENFIAQLIKMGGRTLLLSKDNVGSNPLHTACRAIYGSYGRGWYAEKLDGIITMLIEEGGADIVKEKTKTGKYPIHCCIASYTELLREEDDDPYYDSDSSNHDNYETWIGLEHENFLLLLHKGIQYDIEMEEPCLESLGGLFAVTYDDFPDIWKHWRGFIGYTLENDSRHSYALILHGAIRYKGPPEMYVDIIERFPESITKKDSDDKLPLEKAIKVAHLDWSTTKLMVEATANAQGRSVLNVAAEYNLEWCNGFESLLASEEALQDVRDVQTGLYPYMLAASGDGYDLNVVYELMRRTPQLVMVFFDNEVEKQQDEKAKGDLSEIQLTKQNKKQRTK